MSFRSTCTTDCRQALSIVHLRPLLCTHSRAHDESLAYAILSPPAVTRVNHRGHSQAHFHAPETLATPKSWNLRAWRSIAEVCSERQASEDQLHGKERFNSDLRVGLPPKPFPLFPPRRLRRLGVVNIGSDKTNTPWPPLTSSANLTMVPHSHDIRCAYKRTHALESVISTTSQPTRSVLHVQTSTPGLSFSAGEPNPSAMACDR